MNLTKEDIQFIDNYLSAKVEHIDIRMEMVDHVATALEEQMNNGDKQYFYDVFKDYMIQHKGKLLENNREYLNKTAITLTKKIFKEFIKWPCAITFIGLMLVFRYFKLESDIGVFNSWLGILPILGSLLFGLAYFIALRFYKLERFSAIERIGYVYAMSFQIFYLGWHIGHTKFLENHDFIVHAIVGFSLTLLLAFALVSYNLVKQYRLKYKSTF